MLYISLHTCFIHGASYLASLYVTLRLSFTVLFFVGSAKRKTSIWGHHFLQKPTEGTRMPTCRCQSFQRWAIGDGLQPDSVWHLVTDDISNLIQKQQIWPLLCPWSPLPHHLRLENFENLNNSLRTWFLDFFKIPWLVIFPSHPLKKIAGRNIGLAHFSFCHQGC